MLSLKDFIESESSEMLNHLKIEFGKYYVNETRGIFNGCESIANYFTKEIINRTNEGNISDRIIFTPKKKIYKWFESLICEYVLDSKCKDITGETFFEREIDKISKKQNLSNNYEFKITSPLNVNKFDLRGIIMHELTHIYFCVKIGRETYIKQKRDSGYYNIFKSKNIASKILYLIDYDEVKAFVAQFQSDIFKYQPKDANDAYSKLKENELYIYYSALFKLAIQNNIDNYYPELFDEYRKSISASKEYSNAKIKSIINSKIIKAWKLIIKDIPVMCADSMKHEFRHVNKLPNSWLTEEFKKFEFLD